VKFFSSTSEFTSSVCDDPQYSLTNSYDFASYIFGSYKEKKGTKITGNLNAINIDDQPASSFSYSEVNKQTMTVVLVHKNIGYVLSILRLKKILIKTLIL